MEYSRRNPSKEKISIKWNMTIQNTYELKISMKLHKSYIFDYVRLGLFAVCRNIYKYRKGKEYFVFYNKYPCNVPKILNL